MASIASTHRRTKKTQRNQRRELIDVRSLKSGPYSRTDTSENRAITVLQGLLDEHRVKAELQRRDKRPNIDGYVDIVDEDSCSIGQIDVQVKTLGKSRIKTLSYPCDLGLLGYCFTGASRQVILIGVDVAGGQAFWVHLSRPFLSTLKIRKTASTVSIRFPPNNLINSSSDAYISEWTKIVKDHATKLARIDPLQEEISDEEKTIALLIKHGAIESERYSKNFVSIQKFLDVLNKALEDELSVARTVLYPNVWKVGLVYSEFSEKSLCYALFPINKGHNEPLIRQVDTNVWAEIRKRFTPGKSHGIEILGFSSNPILENPTQAARKHACSLGKKIILSRSLNLSHELLAREFIFSLIDRHGPALGLTAHNSLRVEELASGLYEFLPHWAEYILGILCPDYNIPDYLCGPGSHISLDSIRTYFTGSLEEADAQVRNRIKSGKKPAMLPPIGSVRFPLGILRQHIAYLAEKRVVTVRRLYRKASFPSGNSGVPGNQQPWRSGDFAANLKILMTSTLSLYNHVVQLNFPLLRAELSYFQGFDRLVMVVGESHAKFGTFWGSIRYCLKEVTHTDVEPKLDIYFEESDPIPAITTKKLGDVIEIEGIKYTIDRINLETCDANFFLQPLHDAIFSTLLDRFSNYSKRF